ncbi:MAG: diguanylate cyclase [Ardenticatenia bacterium]|nr:MAG: diguanylate cyclase [Ardenticatenia bacterium]
MNLAQDGLTGAYQREGLLPVLEYLVSNALTYAPCSLLFIDIDYFKSINDAFGHKRGDDVLRIVGATIRRHIREGDFLFRYGGDELVLVLPQSTRQDAFQLAQRLLAHFQTTPIPGTPPLRISLSIGIATVPDEATTAEDLLTVANQRLHMAKTNGRAQISNVDHQTHLLPSHTPPPPLPSATQENFRAFCHALGVNARATLGVQTSEAEARFLFRALTPIAAAEKTLLLMIEGAPSRKMRLFGALAPLTAPHPPPPTPADLAAFLHARAKQHNADAVVLFVLHADALDTGTADLLADLDPFMVAPLGVMWHTTGDAHRRPSAHLQLEHLTTREVQHWLEGFFQQPVDADVTTFLLEKSAGCPVLLEHWLHLCLDKHLFVFEQSRWRLIHTLPANLVHLSHRVGERGPSTASQRTPALPPSPPLFVGREAELAHLQSLFQQPTVIAVSGAVGCGKTTLVAQAARENAHMFDQVLFFLCEPTETPETLFASFCAALGAPSIASFDDIQTLLRHTRLLLILDTPPASLEEHAFWRQLLHHPLNSVIVVIGTDLPHIAWRVDIEVQGLPLPAVQTPFEQWRHEPCLWLLRSLIQHVEPTFEITPSNIALLVQIARLMDGIPLAFEAAATLLAKHGVHFLETWVEQLLDHPQEMSPLTSIQMHMLNRLTSQEQTTLQGLALFNGVFGHRAARHVVGVSPFLLEAFYRESFLQRPSPGVYELKPFLRLLLRRRFHETPETWLHFQQALVQFYINKAPLRLHDMRTSAYRSGLAWVQHRLADIEQIWAFAIETAQYEALIALGDLMYFYFDYLNHFAKGRAFFAKALLLPAETPIARQALSVAHARYAIFCRRLGLYETSEQHLHTALEFARQTQSVREQVFCLNHLGYVCMRRGTYDEALAHLEEARRLLSLEPDRHLQGVVFNTLGMVFESMQRYEQAQWAFLRSLALFCRHEDVRGVAFALNNLGIVKEMVGDYDLAEQCYRNSETIFAQLGDHWGRQLPLLNLGDLAIARNQLEEARRAYGEAVRSIRKFVNMPRLYSLMSCVATLLEKEGYIEDAITLHLFIASQPPTVVDATHHVHSRQALRALSQKCPTVHIDTSKSPAVLRLEALYVLTNRFPPEQK